MTDRLKGCMVCFESDIRVDDAEAILDAIRTLRGVASVDGVVANHDDYFARSRVASEIREEFLALYNKLCGT